MKIGFRFSFIAVIIMVFIGIAACGNTEKESLNSGDDEVQEEFEEKRNDETNEDNKGETDKLTITGTFEGLADPHTFEVKTKDKGIVSFQFYDEGIGVALENIKVGQEIRVIYTTDQNGQNLVKTVNPSEGNEKETDKLTISGTFEGLADPHTFEVKTKDKGIVSFQFYDEGIGAALENMKVGREITVIYTTNQDGQNLVETIE